MDINEPESKSVSLAAGETLSLFSGVVSISDDGTTSYNISLVSGSSNTYKIAHNSGTAPVFKAARNLSSDATTEITVTKNGPLLTFTSTSGTLLSLIAGGAVVGDEVRIGDGFNIVNQGKYKILALTATSFQIENDAGQAEGPIVLGALFADILQIFSAAGVQVGDKVDLLSPFSLVTVGTYEITDVNPDYIEIYSFKSLPSETNITVQLNIYNNSKQYIYIESDKILSLSIDNMSVGKIEQLKAGTSIKKGIFMKSGSMYQASVKNEDTSSALIFFVSAE